MREEMVQSWLSCLLLPFSSSNLTSKPPSTWKEAVMVRGDWTESWQEKLKVTLDSSLVMELMG